MSLLPPPPAPAVPAPLRATENHWKYNEQQKEWRGVGEGGETGSYGPSYKNNKHHCNKWRNEFNSGFCASLMIIEWNLRSKTSSRPFKNETRNGNTFSCCYCCKQCCKLKFAKYLAWLISVNYKSRLSTFCKLFRKTFEIKTRKKIKRQNICKNKTIT